MVKIGPVKEHEFKLDSQELIPENETELKNIIKTCLNLKYPCYVDVFDPPREVTTAIGKRVFKAKWCVLVHKDVSSEVTDIVMSKGGRSVKL